MQNLIQRLYKIKLLKRLIPSLLKLFIFFFRKKEIIISIKNMLINLNLSNPIDREIYLKGNYEKDQLDFLSELIDNNNVNIFLDIGAHLGFYTLILSKKKIPIYSFEPVKQNFDQLTKNIRINNLKNVNIYNLALSNVKKNIKMWVPDKLRTGGFTILDNNDRELKKYSKKKNFVTQSESDLADNILNFSNQIIAAKIDVERHEKKVLEGMQNIIKNNRMILQVEIFDEKKNEILGYLKKENFLLLKNIKKDYFLKNF